MIVKKSIMYLSCLIVFILSLGVFIPKVNIYYYLEHQLSKRKLILSNENIIERFTSLEISNIKVYLKNKQTTTIKKIEFEYNLFSPLYININIINNNKILTGKIDLLSQKVIFENGMQSDQLSTILTHINFTNQHGVFTYEY